MSMTNMDYQADRQHLQNFLNGSEFGRLTDNQQRYAGQIITRFAWFMKDTQQSDDQHWTTSNFKQVLLGEFSSDRRVANRKFLVAVVPVMKAYLGFLKLSNLDALIKVLNDNREQMQRNGRVKETKSILQLQERRDELAKQVERQKKRNDQLKLIGQINDGLAKYGEFKKIKLAEDDKSNIAWILMLDLLERFEQDPENWGENEFRIVLAGMLPLDIRIGDDQVKYLIPVARALVNYLDSKDLISVQHASQLLTLIGDLKPVVEQIGLLDEMDRHLMALANFIDRERGNHGEVGIKTIDEYLAENSDAAVNYMRWMQPWIEDLNMEDDLTDQDILMGIVDEPVAGLSDDQLDKQRMANERYVRKIAKDFSNAVEFNQLSQAEREDAPGIIQAIAGWMFDIAQEQLATWSPEAFEEVITYYMPMKTTAPASYFEHVTPVLHGFLEFAGKQGEIDLAADLIDTLTDNEDSILSTSQDKNSWGFAKQIGLEMMEEGIDPNDGDAVAAFIKRFNEGISETQDSKTASKGQRKVIPFGKKKRGKKK